ncbi:MAG: c-type cytochrome [Gammaproteobacteria bacterium]|jgi:cytochrome c553|nr:c-type cytochrome [Gammaproteobacteria bacterium]
MHVKKWLVMIFSCGLALGMANAAVADGDPVAGEAKGAMCAGCHGADGNSEAGMFPRLAGQYSSYIVKQLRDFQQGHRANNEIMSGMAATVASVEDAKDIGAFFQVQKLAKQPIMPTDPKLVSQGEKIYNQGVPASGVYGCVNCHGPKGTGKSENIAQFPRLVGQHKEYLVKQLTDFRAGTRANDPAGMMKDIARKLTDDEISAVSEYLAAQVP